MADDVLSLDVNRRQVAGGVTSGGEIREILTNDDGALITESEGESIATATSGRVFVATAGTAVTLVASTTPAKEVTIVAETDNTGVIVVGGSTVVASLATRQGVPLSAGDAFTMSVPGNDLEKIYLDSTVNGDGVTYLYTN